MSELLSQRESAQHGGTAHAVSEQTARLLWEAATDGAVLLENDGTLPLAAGTQIAVFGRCQNDWFYTGYGSGGDVRAPYTISLSDGLRGQTALTVYEPLAAEYEAWCQAHPVEHGTWGQWPRHYPEMPVEDALCDQAAAATDTAVVVIGRSSGEDRDAEAAEGSWYLTEAERTLLRQVTARFAHTVLLLNVGTLLDVSFLREYPLSAVLLLWQGGMESGRAAASLLSGERTPNGRLTDTVAWAYEEYPVTSFGQAEAAVYEEDIYVGYRWWETFCPDRVQYPFGYGRSYTSFAYPHTEVKQTAEGWEVACTVQNNGARHGRDTVQVYVEKPCGALGTPYRELVGFGKTKELAAGESETVHVAVPRERLASYDDRGVTGVRSAWVIPAGTYGLAVGENVRAAQTVYTVTVPATTVWKACEEIGAPRTEFSVWTACQQGAARVPVRQPVATARRDVRETVRQHLPPDLPFTGDRGYTLAEAASGQVSWSDFLAQLEDEELEALSRGDFEMDSPLGARGNAGVLGGITPSLRAKGVVPLTLTDGPSGIRLQEPCALLPIGTLLACTFDEALVERVYAAVSHEMRVRGSHMLLAPGMNLHRHPLCGRNFEYYAEDPLLTGKIAAAAVRGIQTEGVAACPKHFACNNQEAFRNRCDSRLSERALRELYAKGFEICVKEAHPLALMTSYNRVNGVYAHYHYELVSLLLRGEWGFEGCVITDWWMQHAASPEFPSLRDNAYRVRAGVDVLMPGGWFGQPAQVDCSLLETLGQPDGITRGELLRTAEHTLRLVSQTG